MNNSTVDQVDLETARRGLAWATTSGRARSRAARRKPRCRGLLGTVGGLGGGTTRRLT